jgi:hypothetical protein
MSGLELAALVSAVLIGILLIIIGVELVVLKKR